MLSLSKLGALMGVAIGRGWREPQQISCNTTEAGCEAVEKRSFAGGSFEIPVGSPITSVTFYGHHTNRTSDVFSALKGVNQQAVSFTVAAGEIHPLPVEIFCLPYYKVVTNAAGTISVYHVG